MDKTLLALKRDERGRVELNPMKVVQFISGGFVPMNEMCERAGMIERQIFKRTKAVFGYCSLPFDVDQPA